MTGKPSAAYLYCVVRAATRPSMTRAPDGMPGGARPAVHRIAPSLWIVAADVPLDVYGPQAIEPRLQDLDWVSQAALAHEAVVEHLTRARGTTVIPMKLFTLFSSLERAAADVAARRGAIAQTMRRIAGAQEWGVRVFRRPAAASGLRAAQPASGAAFLRARKEMRDAATGARGAAADAARAAFDRLRRLARDARVRDARQEPGTNPPILDAAFLVASTSRARFTSEARRQAQALAAAGADLTLTGPWPAYHFVAAGDAA